MNDDDIIRLLGCDGADKQEGPTLGIALARVFNARGG